MKAVLCCSLRAVDLHWPPPITTFHDHSQEDQVSKSSQHSNSPESLFIIMVVGVISPFSYFPINLFTTLTCPF